PTLFRSAFHEAISRMTGDGCQILKIARVRELVEIDDVVIRVLDYKSDECGADESGPARYQESHLVCDVVRGALFMRRAVDLDPFRVRRMLRVGVQCIFAVKFHHERAAVTFPLHFDWIRPHVADTGNLTGHFAYAIVDSLLVSVGCPAVPLNGDHV